MNILLVNTLYYPYKTGGAEVSVQMLAEGLVNFGHKVTVICLHEFNDIKKNNFNGVNIVYLPLLNLYWPFNGTTHKKIDRLRWHLIDNYNKDMKNLFSKMLAEINPDIVHTHNLTGFSVSIWDAIVENKHPLIHTSRDYYLFNPNTTLFKKNKNQNPNSFMGKLISYTKKKMSSKVDAYIGISNFIKNKHIDNDFFRNSILNEVIYNPVEFGRKKTISEIKNIGFIGRVMPEKGFDIFCEIIEKNNQKYNFFVAGLPANNSESRRLYERAEKLGAIMLGYTDFENFINNVDAVILPTKWDEPFGRVVVECALSGLKVYTLPVGGISEIIPKFNNIEILPENLILQSYVNNSTENVNYINEFSTELCVIKHIDIYQEILRLVK